MRQRKITRGKQDETIGRKRATNRSAAWLWVVLVIAVAGLGLFFWRASPQRTGAGTAPAQASLALPANPDPALPEEEQDRALRREQLEAAEKLLTAYPDNDDAVYLVGLVRDTQGDSEQAMKLWQRALELDPTRADAHASLGYAWLLRDDYAQAQSHLRKALELDPNLQLARIRLGTALSHQGKFEEVIAVLTQVTLLSAEADRLLGEAYLQLKEHAKARASFEAAIKRQPDLTEAYYGLSKACAQLGDREKSSEFFEQFTALKKQVEKASRQDRAEYAPLKITRMSAAQTHTDVGRVYLRLGRFREAEALWLRAAALEPRHTLSRLQLAVLYHQTDRSREALRYYEEVAGITPQDGLVHLNLGRVCLKLRELKRAEQAFKAVIRLAPDQAEGHSGLADVYLREKRNLSEALQLLETAVKLAPQAANFALLSQASALNADHKGALAAIDQALALDPGNPQYLQLRQGLLATK